MADKDEKNAKPEKSQRPPSAEQTIKAGKDEKKAAKQAKADKAAADSKAGKPAAPAVLLDRTLLRHLGLLAVPRLRLCRLTAGTEN